MGAKQRRRRQPVSRLTVIGSRLPDTSRRLAVINIAVLLTAMRKLNSLLSLGGLLVYLWCFREGVDSVRIEGPVAGGQLQVRWYLAVSIESLRHFVFRFIVPACANLPSDLCTLQPRHHETNHKHPTKQQQERRNLPVASWWSASWTRV